MKLEELNKEQLEDFKRRQEEGLEALKKLDLIPSAMTHSVNIGDDVFAIKVQPYLNDTKFLGDKKDETLPTAD